MIKTVCICGAGTMGSGIAQVFAQKKFDTILFDIDGTVLERARVTIQQSLQYLTDKQKISENEKKQIFECLQFSNNPDDCKADLIIEAIIEKIEHKVTLFNQLAGINNAQVIFATNTSSLSVSDIQKNISHPHRVIGMHFFNPAPLMKLVEVVKGKSTNKKTVETVLDFCKKLDKIPVLCKDSPGFIVNRIARQYYLEAMRLVEYGIASLENIDAVMEASGFKMGPFKLMDLIGLDVNLSVSKSIYEALHKPGRFSPSPIQIKKVENNELGRKTGKGFYSYPLKKN